MKKIIIRLICCFVPSKELRRRLRWLNKRISISVVVPCYNTEKYLIRCIKSLESQTAKTIREIILIDDCSTDDTKKLIEFLASKNKKIKPIYLKCNHGPGYVRNVGLKLAKGSYVSFIDPDDYLDNDFYLQLSNVAMSCGKPDVVKGVLIYEKANDSRYRSELNYKIETNHLYFCAEHTTAIYKKSFLNQNNIFYPPDIITGQDVCFISSIVLCTDNIKTNNNAIYYYVRHAGSMDSKDLSHQKVLSRLKMLDYKVNLLNKYNFDKENNKRIFIIKHIKEHFIYLFNSKKQEQASQRLVEQWRDNHPDIFIE